MNLLFQSSLFFVVEGRKPSVSHAESRLSEISKPALSMTNDEDHTYYLAVCIE